MIKQNQPYGCGLYAVANAANMPGFVTEDRLEQSKKGNVIGQLSRWMQDDGKPYYIDVLYYNHTGKNLPYIATQYRPKGDASYLPILINVRFSDTGLNHLVGGKIDKEGKLFLYDSLKDDVIETTLSKVNKMYHHVYGLYIFMTLNGDYLFI